MFLFSFFCVLPFFKRTFIFIHRLIILPINDLTSRILLADLPPPKLLEQTQMGTHPTMARSFQIRPLETPTSPTARGCRHPLLYGERPYFPPGGPQRVAHFFEWREITEGWGTGSGGGRGGGCGRAPGAAAACVGLWIGRAGPVFSAAATAAGCEDLCAPAYFIVCA